VSRVMEANLVYR